MPHAIHVYEGKKKKKKFHSTCYSSVKMKHLKVSVRDLLTEFFLN